MAAGSPARYLQVPVELTNFCCKSEWAHRPEDSGWMPAWSLRSLPTARITCIHKSREMSTFWQPWPLLQTAGVPAARGPHGAPDPPDLRGRRCRDVMGMKTIEPELPERHAQTAEGSHTPAMPLAEQAVLERAVRRPGASRVFNGRESSM